MKVTGVEAIPFTIPMHHELTFASGSISSAEHVLVRVHTDEGLVGHAEAPARPFTYGESQESIVKAVRDWLGPPLIGLDPLAVEQARERMAWVVHNHSARGALDMALWDLAGQIVGQPCNLMLGGYATDLPVAHILGDGTPDAMVDEAIAARERWGFTIFKIKVGKDLSKDLQVCRSLRAALGDEVELYVDANHGWRADQAIRALPALSDIGISILEEPTPASEPLARRRVVGQSRVPVMGDESCTRLGEVAQQVLDGQSHAISLKVARTGFTESQRIVGLCEALGVDVIVGSQMDTMIGTLCSVTFGAAVRSLATRFGELSVYLQMKDDLLAEPLVITGGRLAARESPGVGIDIDEDKLAHFRVDR